MNDQPIATITQQELEEVAVQRRKLQSEQRKIREKEKNLMALILAGADVEPGCFVPEIIDHRGKERLRIVEHGAQP